MTTPTKTILPVVALVAAAALVAVTAGLAYAAVALLVGLVILGGLAAGYGVAKADEVPFSTDEGASPLGDTTEHSDVTSAVPHPPR